VSKCLDSMYIASGGCLSFMLPCFEVHGYGNRWQGFDRLIANRYQAYCFSSLFYGHIEIKKNSTNLKGLRKKKN
jgi:hypothetical protein